MTDSDSRSASLKSLAIGVGAVAITVVVMLVVFRRATGEKNPAVAPSEMASVKLRSAEEQAAAQQLAEKEITARLAREYFLAQVSSASADVTALEAEVKLWQTDVDSMFTSDLGRGIASSDEASQGFRVIYEKQKPNAPKVAALRSALELLRKQVEAPHSESGTPSLYVPGDALKQELARIGREASQMLQQQKQARLDILALGHGHAPANITLRQKLDELDRLASERRTDAIRAAEIEAFDSMTKDVAAAKAAATREKEKTKLDAVNEEIAEEKRLQRMNEAKGNKEMLALLTPLSAPGYKQPGRARTIEKGPVSFAKLSSGGYLEGDDFNSLERFVLFLHIERENDRPIWTLPGVRINGRTYQQLPEPLQMKIRGLQTFVREYGAELVELGYLAK